MQQSKNHLVEKKTVYAGANLQSIAQRHRHLEFVQFEKTVHHFVELVKNRFQFDICWQCPSQMHTLLHYKWSWSWTVGWCSFCLHLELNAASLMFSRFHSLFSQTKCIVMWCVRANVPVNIKIPASIQIT